MIAGGFGHPAGAPPRTCGFGGDHARQRLAVSGAGADVAEPGLARGGGGALADRIAGERKERRHAAAGQPRRIGARQQDRAEAGGSGRRPGDRPNREQRSDDRIEPHRPGPRRGLAGAGLRAEDQNLHGWNIARNAGLASASSRRASASGSPSPALTSRPSALRSSARTRTSEASAATAEWQSPPSAARKARSAVTASCVGR